MNTWILIIVMATSTHHYSGATTVTAEFLTNESCVSAHDELIKEAEERKNFILTAGCFKKSK